MGRPGPKKTPSYGLEFKRALDGLSRHKYGPEEETLESRCEIQKASSFDRVRSRRCRIRSIKGG